MRRGASRARGEPARGAAPVRRPSSSWRSGSPWRARASCEPPRGRAFATRTRDGEPAGPARPTRTATRSRLSSAATGSGSSARTCSTSGTSSTAARPTCASSCRTRRRRSKTRRHIRSRIASPPRSCRRARVARPELRGARTGRRRRGEAVHARHPAVPGGRECRSGLSGSAVRDPRGRAHVASGAHQVGLGRDRVHDRRSRRGPERRRGRAASPARGPSASSSTSGSIGSGKALGVHVELVPENIARLRRRRVTWTMLAAPSSAEHAVRRDHAARRGGRRRTRSAARSPIPKAKMVD